jgi:hypothetical protein
MIYKFFLDLGKNTFRIIEMFFYDHGKFEEYLQFFGYLFGNLSLVTKDWGKCIVNKGHNWFSQATFWGTYAWTAFYLLIGTHMISAFFEFSDIDSRFLAINSNSGSYPCTLLVIFWCLTARNKYRFLDIGLKLLKLWRRYHYFSLVLQIMWNL